MNSNTPVRIPLMPELSPDMLKESDDIKPPDFKTVTVPYRVYQRSQVKAKVNASRRALAIMRIQQIKDARVRGFDSPHEVDGEEDLL